MTVCRIVGPALLLLLLLPQASQCGPELQHVDSYLWSSPRSVTLDGDIAYVTFVNGLKVYDLWLPGEPAEIAQVDFPANGAAVLDHSRDIFYVCNNNGDGTGVIGTFDVSTPDTPTLLSTLETDFEPTGLTVSDSFLLVSFWADSAWAGENGLSVLSLSDPGSPVEAGRVTLPSMPMSLTVQGSLAYVGGTALSVVDCSDPEAPYLLAEYEPEIASEVSSIVARDSILFVAESTWLGEGWSALRLLNVADPLNPLELGNLRFAGIIPEMCLDDQTLLLANEDKVYAIDITDLTRPDTVGKYTAWGFVTDFGYDDGIMMTADHGYRYVFKQYEPTDPQMRLLDWTDRSAPTLVGKKAVYAEVLSAVASEHYAFAILDTETTTNVATVDITTMSSSPIVAEYRALGQPGSLVLSDSLLLILGTYGLEILNIATPDQPMVVRRYPIASVTGPTARAAYRDGNLVWVAASSYGLYGYDLTSTSDEPTVTIPEVGYATELLKVGDFIYVFGPSYGQVVFVKNPLAPTVLGSFGSGWCRDVAVLDGLLYVGLGSGYSVFDIATDPSAPILVHTESSLKSASNLHFDLPYLYVAGGWGGIVRYDLSDPRQPFRDVAYDTPGIAGSVFATDRTLLVADRWSLIQLQVDIATEVFDPESSTLPTAFTLYQNYPNPFNPSTVVQFELPHRSAVTLSVINILGQMVLSRKMDLPAGRHRVELNLDGQPSGVYFYRLSGPYVTASRKMLLVK